jgi:hypothetical protein
VHRKLKQNFAGHNIWARGLMVSTVGRGETVIRDVVAPSSSRHGSFGGPNNSHGAQHQVGDEDGFAVGFIYGLLAGELPEEAIKLGRAHCAMRTALPGDTTMTTLNGVRAFAKGRSARIEWSLLKPPQVCRQA